MMPYTLADLVPPPGKRLVSLAQNESLRPPAPAVAEAIAQAARASRLYPDPDCTELRNCLAGLHGLNPSGIICGNGSLDLIGCITRAYLQPGSAALAPAHAYPFFRTATLLTGARFDTAPEADLTMDPQALLAAVKPETRVVLVANPGNPTGTRISRSSLLRLRKGLPDEVLLVIDEAYAEFAEHLGEPVFDLVDRGNTVVVRTLSKAYGLAGLRVGWGLFPEQIGREVRKLLDPNNVSVTAQAVAVAALRDQPYMRETCAQTKAIRDRFANRMRAAGLRVPQSHTNFVLLGFPSPEAASRANAALRAEGVFLRMQAGAGLPDCLRATVGVASDMDLAASLIEDWLRGEANP